MPDLARRTLLRGAGAAAAGLLTAPLLSACGTSSAPPVTSGPVDISLWTHDPGYVTTYETAVEDASLMRGSRFDYRMRITSAAPPDIVTRMMAQAVADGNTPDLAGIVIDQYPRVMGSNIARNLFVDLSETVRPFGDGLLKLAPYTVDGVPYGLDSDNSITVLYYRHDLFERYGIPEDTGTWEELAERGERLHTDRGISLGMVSTGDNGAIVNGFLQLLLQRGGGFFDTSGELTLDSPEAVEVLEFMARGVRSGVLLALPDPYGSACAAALKSGRLAATAMPNWYNAEFGLFRRVVLPLLRPALGALGVWSFLNSYNSLIWPLIVVSDPGDYTLPLGIQALFGATGRQYDLVLAGAVLAAVPSLLVFFLLRRQLLEGLTAGAVKS